MHCEGVWLEGVECPPKNEGSSSIILEHLVPGNVHPKCPGASCCAFEKGRMGLKSRPIGQEAESVQDGVAGESLFLCHPCCLSSSL